MRVKLTGPTDIVLSRFEATDLQATEVRILFDDDTPTDVIVSLAALRVTVPDDDPEADPSVERRIMPPTQLSGDAVAPLVAAINALMDGVFAALQGTTLPEGAVKGQRTQDTPAPKAEAR